MSNIRQSIEKIFNDLSSHPDITLDEIEAYRFLSMESLKMKSSSKIYSAGHYVPSCAEKC